METGQINTPDCGNPHKIPAEDAAGAAPLCRDSFPSCPDEEEQSSVHRRSRSQGQRLLRDGTLTPARGPRPLGPSPAPWPGQRVARPGGRRRATPVSVRPSWRLGPPAPQSDMN